MNISKFLIYIPEVLATQSRPTSPHVEQSMCVLITTVISGSNKQTMLALAITAELDGYIVDALLQPTWTDPFHQSDRSPARGQRAGAFLLHLQNPMHFVSGNPPQLGLYQSLRTLPCLIILSYHANIIRSSCRRSKTSSPAAEGKLILSGDARTVKSAAWPFLRRAPSSRTGCA